MCVFFSFVTYPSRYGGKRFYFNAKQRKELKDIEFDSHSSICRYYNLNEDKCNKYEYDFNKNKCETDQINSYINDEVQAHIWAEKLQLGDIIDLDDYKLKIGDIYIFKPLDYFRYHEVDCGFNFKGMSKYVNSKMEFVVNEAVIMRYIINARSLWQIYDADAPNDKYWMISLDMLELKK